MKYYLKLFLTIAAVLTLPVACETWKFHECKKVGHGTAYCIVMLGNRR